jgi:hypothetical protein
MAKLSSMSDDEAGAALLKAYRRACDCYDEDNDAHGQHPGRDVRRWIQIAATGGQNSEGKIQSQDDDPQPVNSANGNSGNGGEEPTMDAARDVAEDDMIRRSGSADIAGDLALASARRSSPARIRAMARLIPGYDRLRK